MLKFISPTKRKELLSHRINNFTSCFIKDSFPQVLLKSCIYISLVRMDCCQQFERSHCYYLTICSNICSTINDYSISFVRVCCSKLVVSFEIFKSTIGLQCLCRWFKFDVTQVCQLHFFFLLSGSLFFLQCLFRSIFYFILVKFVKIVRLQLCCILFFKDVGSKTTKTVTTGKY